MTEKTEKTQADKDLDEKVKRFEEMRATKRKELGAVLSYLGGTVGLKSHKGILMGAKSCEYFRGVNFHIAVLSHGDAIMKMIPSLVNAGEIKQLKTIEDSIKLGQYMILCRSILQLRKDPRYVQSGNEKTPKFVIPEKDTVPMSDKGIYMVLEEENKSTQ